MYSYDSIDSICQILTGNETESAAHSVALAFKFEDLCIALNYNEMLNDTLQTALNSTLVRIGSRQALYQSCNELGWFHSSDSIHQPFGGSFPLDVFNQICGDVFGENFNNASVYRNSDRLNVVHGGLNPEVTNVIFTHGKIDPWRTIGVQRDLNDFAPAFIIPGMK